MEITNRFAVNAPPDQVYSFLLDINKVAGCMPGAELSEVVDPDTFRGKVTIRVGPIKVSYNGTAKITERDEANRVAKLAADGRETTGPGSARATATMTVAPAETGSEVVLDTDFQVAGKVANFGRGIMEDVSKRLVAQMADCIKAHLEEVPAAAAAAGAPVEGGAVAAAPGAPVPAPQPPPQAKPVNAISLFFSVLWERIRRLFGGGSSR